jgi:hypothetical protein
MFHLSGGGENNMGKAKWYCSPGVASYRPEFTTEVAEEIKGEIA